MYIKRHLNFVIVYFYTWRMVLISLFTGALAIFLYEYLGWTWVAIPWLPVSLVGTATAFFVGFKNNQAYDRSWEARIIWGGITNLSRGFSSAAKSFINNRSITNTISQPEIDREVKALVYRHLAWLNALKIAMHQHTTWEHNDAATRRQRKAVGTDKWETVEEATSKYLSAEELNWVVQRKNPATHILDKQSQHLTALKAKGLLNDLEHMELQKFVTDLYGEQGKSERIKNTPFPRQYGTTSTIFIFIFMVLLPFGMIAEFLKLGHNMLWLLIPFNVVVTWVFLLMEYTGDVSENPFEGMLNDTPIRAIVRNIEIDLKEMLNEQDLPEKIQPNRLGVLY